MGQIPVSLCVCTALFFCLPLNSFTAQNSPSAQQTPGAPVAPAPEFHAAPSAQCLARGKYLVEGTAHCFECHGLSDFGTGLGQSKSGTAGAGQILKDDVNDDKMLPPAFCKICKLNHGLGDRN